MTEPQQMSTAQSTNPASPELVCLLMPTLALPMLVPNVVVAEVLLHTVVEPDERFVWLVGWVYWRGVVVPVIAYEHLNEDEAAMNVAQVNKIAIFHAVSGQGEFAYYAICLAGSPKLMTITAQEVTEEKAGEPVMQGVLVDIDGIEAIIPELEWLESQLQQLDAPSHLVFKDQF